MVDRQTYRQKDRYNKFILMSQVNKLEIILCV